MKLAPSPTGLPRSRRPLAAHDMRVPMLAPRWRRTPAAPFGSTGAGERAETIQRPLTLTTIASWVDRAITTTASVSGDRFSSRCGTCGGTQT